jgi:hypothetical protein
MINEFTDTDLVPSLAHQESVSNDAIFKPDALLNQLRRANPKAKEYYLRRSILHYSHTSMMVMLAGPGKGLSLTPTR